MKHLLFKSCSLLLVALLSVTSCKKKQPPVVPNTDPGKVKIEFNNNVGNSTLNLGSHWYVNENGDSFTVAKFNYYATNFVLTGPNGATYTEVESYHLIQQDKAASMSFDMVNVPAASYDSISFMVGVDRERNTTGAQTGALDPLNGMFWDWVTGYIMLKLEGTSPQSPNGRIEFHCGNFIGANSSLRTIKLPLSNVITVNQNATPHVHVTANVLALFKSPNMIDFSTVYNVSTSSNPNIKKLADNYTNMFSITHAGL